MNKIIFSLLNILIIKIISKSLKLENYEMGNSLVIVSGYNNVIYSTTDNYIFNYNFMIF